MEVGNVSLMNIFALNKGQFDAFKLMLNEMKIWGSYRPLKDLLEIKNYCLEYN